VDGLTSLATNVQISEDKQYRTFPQITQIAQINDDAEYTGYAESTDR